MVPEGHEHYSRNTKRRGIVELVNCKIIKGYFPKRQLKLILAWCEIHKDELMQNWELARTHQPLYRIAPLS
ncbi:DUF4160 domain-containing protein [Clostridium tetani]|uniref:DUF4160 domain-containing protein n=1 Tax=Clostridium tetani TaxID=1513 RepID=UPI003D15AE3C